MYCNAVNPNDMAKKVNQKPMAFRDAILLALHTPHLTHKQIIEQRKKEKQLNKNKK
jgi:hypothetical protein